MKANHNRTRLTSGGYSMVLVMLISSATLLILAGIISWSSSNATLNARNNEYFKTMAAAEAAAEKVIAHLTENYIKEGEGVVTSPGALDAYRALVPTVTEDPRWADYRFSDGMGNTDRTHVEHIPPSMFKLLDSQYSGLHGWASSFRIISNARNANSMFQVVSAVRQDIDIASIPLFQFAIFYNIDLEIHPGPNMTVTGPVHCNANMYVRPGATLTFKSDVTASGTINNFRKPGDPLSAGSGTTVYTIKPKAGVSTLNLPIGTNNSPLAVRQIVEIPPPGEPVDSPMGRQRYYNKADLIILTYNNTNDVRIMERPVSGAGIATGVSSNHYNYFLTNVSFYNKREKKTVRATQIDVAKLKLWSETNTLRPTVKLRTIYVADLRTPVFGTQPGVRLINGETNLSYGFTVATPQPLYVKGHYNAPVALLRGTTNTTITVPASLVGDSITVLSPAWNDANANQSLGSRIAVPTTVNAAFLAGIVPTTMGEYSGGVENFPRFLEDWSGKTFTYNGSMVVMYQSQHATGLWEGTGTTYDIYNPPVRGWAFDSNFTNPAKLPPATPVVRVLLRGQWSVMRPNSTVAVPN
jgi:hypothetical protein